MSQSPRDKKFKKNEKIDFGQKNGRNIEVDGRNIFWQTDHNLLYDTHGKTIKCIGRMWCIRNDDNSETLIPIID